MLEKYWLNLDYLRVLPTAFRNRFSRIIMVIFRRTAIFSIDFWRWIERICRFIEICVTNRLHVMLIRTFERHYFGEKRLKVPCICRFDKAKNGCRSLAFADIKKRKTVAGSVDSKIISRKPPPPPGQGSRLVTRKSLVSSRSPKMPQPCSKPVICLSYKQANYRLF